MTTDSNPLYNPPLSKSDDDANEREEVLIHEHLFDSSNIGVETGSIKTIVNKNETSVTGLTKRLGEVDYTEVESLLRITAYSANRNRAISLNDSDKSHFKRHYQLLEFTFKNLAWTRHSIMAVVNY